jgi:NAD-dependent epimerase/dehydratase
LKIGKYLLSKSAYGTIEFVFTVMAMDSVAPMKVGKHRLKVFFEELRNKYLHL